MNDEPTKEPRADDQRENFRDASGNLFLVRCPKCKRENYAFCVAVGQCAWCGWKEEEKK